MQQVNFGDLAGQLIDSFALNETLSFIQKAIGDSTLSFSGPGVAATPFNLDPLIPSVTSALAGNVTRGIAYDENGQLVVVPTSVNTFAIEAADGTNPRRDLLVLSYQRQGDLPVPKPTDPLTTVYYYLRDGFKIQVRKGTAAASPAYPLAQPGEIILAGIQVAAGATTASGIALDQSIRQVSLIPAKRFSLNKSKIRVSDSLDLQGVMDDYNRIFEQGALALGGGQRMASCQIAVSDSNNSGGTLTLDGKTLTIANTGENAVAAVSQGLKNMAFQVCAKLRKMFAGDEGQLFFSANYAGIITISCPVTLINYYSVTVTGTNFTLINGGAFTEKGSARKYALAANLNDQISQLDNAIKNIHQPGSTMLWFADKPPVGYIDLSVPNLLIRPDNPILFALIGTRYGYTTDQTFFAPLINGFFPRAYEPNNSTVVRDPDGANRTKSTQFGATGPNGREVGTEQSDDFASHSHNYAGGYRISVKGGDDPRGFDVNTQTTAAAGGNETRPKNINVMFIMKIG